MIKEVSIYVLMFFVLTVFVGCKDGKPLKLRETPAPQKSSTDGATEIPGQDPGDGGQNPGDGGQNPGDGGQNPGDGGQNPGDGGQNPGDGGQNPGDGGQNPGDGGQNPGDGGQNPGDGEKPAVPGSDTPPVSPGGNPHGGDEVSKPDYINSIGMKFVRIPAVPAGSFFIGGSCKVASKCLSGTTVTTDAKDDETPQYRARINAFKIGIYEVTLGQFKQFISSESKQSLLPGSFDTNNDHGDEAAVVRVSWDVIHDFISWLNRKESQSGRSRYRLPTEAEWEYVARAGTNTRFFWGSSSSKASASIYAWHRDTGERYVHPVGQKRPNPWGVYDMYGNVFEVVSDWYENDYYSSINGIGNNPRGHSKGEIVEKYRQEGRINYCNMTPVASNSNPCHISRGGSYFYSVSWMSSAHRNPFSGNSATFNDMGFRLAKGE